MRRAAKLPKLDADLIKVVEGPILSTWQAIGNDICEAGGGDVDSETAVECCIDADRLSEYGNSYEEGHQEVEAAKKAIDAAIDAHGYPKVLRFLGRQLRLGR